MRKYIEVISVINDYKGKDVLNISIGLFDSKEKIENKIYKNLHDIYLDSNIIIEQYREVKR